MPEREKGRGCESSGSLQNSDQLKRDHKDGSVMMRGSSGLAS